MDNNPHLPDKIGFQDNNSRLFPRLILMAVTSPCNARCPYCPSEVDREIRKTPGLDGKQENWIRPEYYKRVADECVKYGARMRLSSYGETMLHPQFVELVEYSSSIGVKTSVITNGSCFSTEKIERLIKCGTESIEISMESHDPEIYRKLKVGLKYNQVLANLDSLRRIRDKLWFDPQRYDLVGKLKTFIIVSVVNQPANPKISEAKEFFSGIADHVSVRSYLTWGIPELKNQNPDRKRYLDELGPCPYPYERCMVDPAGFIRLCPYDDQKLIPPFGHVSKDSIATMWQGKRWNDIRSCHEEQFDLAGARIKAPLCGGCQDRRNRSWTFNYVSIAEGKTQ